MTEAEIIVQLNKKQQELAEKRLANASSDTLKALEEEIMEIAVADERAYESHSRRKR